MAPLRPRIANGVGAGSRPDNCSNAQPRRKLPNAFRVQRLERFFVRPISISRRTASLRASCSFFAQASIAAISSAGARTVSKGSVPVAGRPGFLRITDIDLPINVKPPRGGQRSNKIGPFWIGMAERKGFEPYAASFPPSPTLAARLAAMNSSRSPSSTFCGSLRSTFVRRSFTI